MVRLYILHLLFQGDLIQLKCFYGTEGVDGVTIVSNNKLPQPELNGMNMMCIYSTVDPV